MHRPCRCFSCITPPHILKRLLQSSDPDVRDAALSTLLTTAELRGERTVRASMVGSLSSSPSDGSRTIFDARNRRILAVARRVRTETGPASSDETVNRAFDGLGATRNFYKEILQRNSIDGRGMRLDAYVHFSRNYNNAFWNGQSMVFGDGDGKIFTDFTKSLDVIGHELTHGVTENTAGLEYHNQSGALNESISDVFGSLVKQWTLKQSAAEADWLIGAEITTPAIQADALRSMKAPGTAYNNALLGEDPQPDHMSKYVQLPDTEEGDWGGVHINSGIPNKAFFLVATKLGGYAWEAPGHIWYESLKASTPDTVFQEFADTTWVKAGQLYGTGGAQQQAVAAAWGEVGVRTGTGPTPMPVEVPGESLAALANRIEALSAQIQMLTTEITVLRDDLNS
jgi:Zn-dependent metalloprotease